MNLLLDFGKVGTYTVDLPYLKDEAYAEIEKYFIPLVNKEGLKAREAISDAFSLAISLAPNENLSDLWHHVIYRIYKREKIAASSEQSWVRASGDAFELFIANTYNPILEEHGFKLTPLFSGDMKSAAVRRMGLTGKIGSSKIDVLLEQKGKGKSPQNGFGIIGGLHLKASLAERVSDDIPTSRIMMQKGYGSILVTLDVKSFPPPHGDLVNRGELGTPEKPSDKRKYIEEHGDFTTCISYNKRTAPSPAHTLSGRKILVVPKIATGDDFVQAILKQSIS